MNIGIDLGTTNSALAYIDAQEAAEADFPAIQVLDVPQYVAPGRIETRRTLPSFLYLGDQEYVGVYASSTLFAAAHSPTRWSFLVERCGLKLSSTIAIRTSDGCSDRR